MATIPANAVEQTEWKLPDKGTVGVICLIITESSLFTIFVVAYLYYLGKSLIGPFPKEVLTLPVWASICLLSSSATIMVAEHGLKHGNYGKFKLWWGITILLGLEFLHQTGVEWYELIYEHHLTISTNLFGTTYYLLVGLHASHVIVGLTLLTIVLVTTMAGFPMATQFRRVTFLSWYWHFVDAIWIIVFTVVYIVGDKPMANETSFHHHQQHQHAGESVELPAPTSWPMVMALGLTLMGLGMLTHWAVFVVGFLIMSRASVGWWLEVIPHEKHEHVPMVAPQFRPAPIRTSGRSVQSLQVGIGHHRMRVPNGFIHTWQASGGIAGGIAMASLACAYGLFFKGSLWYPINLLSAMVIPGITNESEEALKHFNAINFSVAFVAHALFSVLVGVVYAVTLPMFARQAFLWAGIIGPLAWTALIAATLQLTNPLLNAHVNWISFVVCQLGFGMVAGFVAAKTQRIDTMQNLSFLERAAIEGQFREADPTGREKQ